MNWLIEGYRLLQTEGLTIPEKVQAAIEAYKLETDTVGAFLNECTVDRDENRLPLKMLYKSFIAWSKENGCMPITKTDFTAQLERRYEVKRGNVGMVAVGLAYSPNIYTEQS